MSRSFISSDTRKIITSGGIRINYEIDFPDGKKVSDLPAHKTSSDKPLLLFVHGLSGDLSGWDIERQFFHQKGYTTLALDIRGHGYSDRPAESTMYELEDFANDVKDILDYEGISSCIIIGHCFGAMISLIFNTLYPQYVLKHVLIDTDYKPIIFAESPAMRAFLIRILKIASRVSPKFHLEGYRDIRKDVPIGDWEWHHIIRNILHVSLKDYFMMFEKLIRLDLKDVLTGLKVPTLIMTGIHDSIFPPRIAEEIHAHIANSKINFISQANHLLVLNNPLAVAKAIEAFIAN